MFIDDYIPNEINSDTFLSEVPVSLMKENIISQFEDPLEYRKKDHITTFINMYRFSESNADVYEDEELDSIIELRDDFYAFMREMFMNYLGVGFNDFDDMSKEDQDNLIHYTYRFFLINIKKNFVNLILNYIEKNREKYGYDDEKKKDVTTISLRKEIDDPVDIYILSNLTEIINSILYDEEISVDDFLENCDNEASLETRFVKENYDNFILTGNFIPLYIEMLNIDFNVEIESKVRNKILKKYK